MAPTKPRPAIPQPRPQRLSRLVDRALRMGAALIGLLIVCGVATTVALLVAQGRVAHSYDVLHETSLVREDVQALRLRVGVFIVRGDRSSRDDVTASIRSASARIATLRTLVGSNEAQIAPLDRLAGAFDERVRSSTQLMSTADFSTPIEARARPMTEQAYQVINTRLMDSIDQMERAEELLLAERRSRQSGILFVLAIALGGLVLWAAVILARSRRAAHDLIGELSAAYRDTAVSKAELEAFIDASPLGLFHLDEKGLPTYFNAEAIRMGELVTEGGSVADWLASVHPEDSDALNSAWDRLLRTNESLEEMFRLVRKDGSPVWVESHLAPVLVENRTTGFVGVCRDLSERKALEENLFAAKEAAQVTLESIGDAVIATDAEGVITFLNPRAAVLLETEAQMGIGVPVDELLQLVDEDGEASPTSLLRAIEENRTIDVIKPRRLVLSDGTRLDIEDVAAPIRNRQGTVIGGVLVLRDVSIAQAIADRMRHLAEYDVLTDLPNRLLFEDRARQALHAAMRHRARVGLLYIDLDGFKQVNDTHGHGAGDELLRQVAACLESTVRLTDTVCRIGGDEFVVLMPEVSDGEGAMNLAEKIVAAAQGRFSWHGQQLDVTFSVGAALYPDHATDVIALMRQADRALYRAKQSGRNRALMASHEWVKM